jgi:methionyl-tRNA formyltransferase
MGTSDFAVPVLEKLLKSNNHIVNVYTQPPRPAGRGKRLVFSPVALLAQRNGLSIKYVENFKEVSEISYLKRLKADLVVVVSYGIILPKEIISSTRYGCFNVHPSLLPRWRGAAPIQRALLENDASTGVCIIRMDEGLDTGPICLREELCIDKNDNYGSLHTKLSLIGAKLILHLLNIIDEVKFTEQSETEVIYAEKIQKIETRLNWNTEAYKVVSKIRAFSPTPGAWFNCRGERIKILSGKVGNNSGTPGQVLNSSLEIACSVGSIVPEVVKRSGKSAMKVEEFLRGFTISEGTLL